MTFNSVLPIRSRIVLVTTNILTKRKYTKNDLVQHRSRFAPPPTQKAQKKCIEYQIGNQVELNWELSVNVYTIRQTLNTRVTIWDLVISSWIYPFLLGVRTSWNYVLVGDIGLYPPKSLTIMILIFENQRAFESCVSGPTPLLWSKMM